MQWNPKSYVSDPDKLKQFVAEELGLMLTSEFSIQEEQNFANWENVGRVEQGKKLNYSSFGHCFVKAVDVTGNQEAGRLATRYAARLAEVDERGEQRLREKEKNVLDNQLLNTAKGKKELWQKIQYAKQQVGEEALQQAINNPMIRDRLSGQIQDKLGKYMNLLCDVENEDFERLEAVLEQYENRKLSKGRLDKRVKDAIDNIRPEPGSEEACQDQIRRFAKKLEKKCKDPEERLSTPVKRFYLRMIEELDRLVS